MKAKSLGFVSASMGCLALLTIGLGTQWDTIGARGANVMAKKPHLTVGSSIIASHTFNDELIGLDTEVASRQALVHEHPQSWIHLDKLATAHLNRARLTGDMRDYQLADDTINRAFDLSGNQVGPFLSRANIHSALHQFDLALIDLETAKKALLVDQDTINAINGLYADVLLQAESTERAKSIAKSLELIKPTMFSAARLGHVFAKMGEFEVASQWYLEAESRVVGDSAYQHAWLKLQQGILALEQRQLSRAYDYFNQANSRFPGFWLIEEHIAEVDALQGRTDRAEHAYRDLIDRTEFPLFMEALANILESRNASHHKAEITSLRSAAKAKYDLITSAYPEWTSGHTGS